MTAKSHQIKNLEELYELMGFSSDGIKGVPGFTIHQLQNTFKELPFTSVPFRPNYFSFLFIKQAKGKYTIDDQVFKVDAHTIYFTNPGNYHIFHWDQVVDVYLITFDESFLKEYIRPDIYQPFAFLLTEIVAPKKLSSEVFKQFTTLNQLIQQEYQSNSPLKPHIIGGLLGSLLYKIKEHLFIGYNPISEGNRGSQIVNTFKKDLEQHFRDLMEEKIHTQWRVQDYANRQNLHVNYLSNVISNKTGKSISQWISEKTITEAKVLLQNSPLSVKEISHRLGFQEAPYFSNYFKKHTKESPSQYREKHYLS